MSIYLTNEVEILLLLVEKVIILTEYPDFIIFFLKKSEKIK